MREATYRIMTIRRRRIYEFKLKIELRNRLSKPEKR